MKLALLFILLHCLGCSGSKPVEIRHPPAVVRPTPVSNLQNDSSVWQENFNRQQAQQNKKSQDERFRQEQRSIFEQQQRDNFRRLSNTQHQFN